MHLIFCDHYFSSYFLLIVFIFFTSDLFDEIRDGNLLSVRSTIDIYPWRLNDVEMGSSLYHHAAEYNRPRILEYLLGVDTKLLNTTGGRETTPLHIASRFGYIDCVQLLLSHGANV